MGFWDEAKGWMQKGAEASKNAFEKAGDAVQDFSDKSVLKIEIKKLENKKNELFSQIGEITFNKLKADDNACINGNDIEVVEIIKKITELESEIERKRKELEQKE